ncbi:MAG TPA: RusA family crossover junction endodeoxyribonuclease [Thermoleophilia bacterium]|nr:RusA family crossover junction endodeoxyribonuclease [Thermoleophilia bacterium]
MSGLTLRLTLPIPPSVNHSHHNCNINGRLMRVPSKAAKAWTKACIVACYEAMNRAGWPTPCDCKTIVEYTVYWPDKRRRDPSNLEKVLLDGIEAGGIVTDDKWCLPRCQDFTVDRGNPRVEVACRRWGA